MVAHARDPRSLPARRVDGHRRRLAACEPADHPRRTALSPLHPPRHNHRPSHDALVAEATRVVGTVLWPGSSR